jgi:CBS domain-containing protein
MINISKLMSSPLLSINSKSRVLEGVMKMWKNNCSALLVEEDDEYVGIFTKTDWVDIVRKEVCDPNVIKISDVMVNPVIKIDKNGTLGEAINLIEENYIRHLVVTDKGKVVGMFSVKDLEHYFCQLHDQEGIVKYKF